MGLSSTYVLFYEIGDGGDTSALTKKIKSYSGWAKISKNGWGIVSSKKAAEIRDELAEFIGENGRLFVIKSGKGAAWRNIIASNDWFKKNL